MRNQFHAFQEIHLTCLLAACLRVLGENHQWLAFACWTNWKFHFDTQISSNCNIIYDDRYTYVSVLIIIVYCNLHSDEGSKSLKITNYLKSINVAYDSKREINLKRNPFWYFSGDNFRFSNHRMIFTLTTKNCLHWLVLQID